MKKAEHTKRTIVEKAAVVFNEKGIAGASIDDILRASKVAKGCLYGHFESKEELCYASVDYLFELICTRQDEQTGKHKSALDRLLAFFDLNKNPLNPYITGGCPIINLATEADDTNPKIKKKLRTVITKTLLLLTGIMEDGIQCGEFSKTLHPESFAMNIVSALEGANAISRIMNSNKPMKNAINYLKADLLTYCLTER